MLCILFYFFWKCCWCMSGSVTFVNRATTLSSTQTASKTVRPRNTMSDDASLDLVLHLNSLVSVAAWDRGRMRPHSCCAKECLDWAHRCPTVNFGVYHSCGLGHGHCFCALFHLRLGLCLQPLPYKSEKQTAAIVVCWLYIGSSPSSQSGCRGASTPSPDS